MRYGRLPCCQLFIDGSDSMFLNCWKKPTHLRCQWILFKHFLDATYSTENCDYAVMSHCSCEFLRNETFGNLDARLIIHNRKCMYLALLLVSQFMSIASRRFWYWQLNPSSRRAALLWNVFVMFSSVCWRLCSECCVIHCDRAFRACASGPTDHAVRWSYSGQSFGTNNLIRVKIFPSLSTSLISRPRSVFISSLSFFDAFFLDFFFFSLRAAFFSSSFSHFFIVKSDI